MPDTHTHLEDAVFDVDRDAVVARARAAGVERILVVGTDAASSKRAVTLARQYEEIYAAVGIHPHEADRWCEDAETVRGLIGEEKVVAIGEIGLDYYRSGSTRLVQLDIFRRQLEWARDAALPVSVHMREADADVLRTLDGSEVDVILHCFSGTEETARTALQRGYYISFAGNITYPKAEHLRTVAGVVPLERVLVETDSPVLAPQGHRGRRNEPENVVKVVQQLAEIYGCGTQAVEEAVVENANRLFGWREAA